MNKIVIVLLVLLANQSSFGMTKLSRIIIEERGKRDSIEDCAKLALASSQFMAQMKESEIKNLVDEQQDKLDLGISNFHFLIAKDGRHDNRLAACLSYSVEEDKSCAIKMLVIHPDYANADILSEFLSRIQKVSNVSKVLIRVRKGTSLQVWVKSVGFKEEKVNSEDEDSPENYKSPFWQEYVKLFA